MIGLLLDTFLVRPLMVPAFVVVFKRMSRPAAGAGAGERGYTAKAPQRVLDAAKTQAPG